jgi:hypothetical protein
MERVQLNIRLPVNTFTALVEQRLAGDTCPREQLLHRERREQPSPLI